MSKHLETWLTLHSDSVPTFLSPFSPQPNTSFIKISHCPLMKTLNLRNRGVQSFNCSARRRVRYDNEENEDEDEDKEYGHNEQIAMLESYTQSATGEALIVKATVDDDDQVEVLIFKGFSSCLSYRTSPDPSRSVLPRRAVINSIDRIKGPFDPTNIEYLQKGITWELFQSILLFK